MAARTPRLPIAAGAGAAAASRTEEEKALALEQQQRLGDEQARTIAEQTRLVDEGRALLETDRTAAHALFERAYLLNLNDLRVMSHYGMTLVLVEGDRQRGIRFCEEAVRRGPVTSELLVNLARALVLTRNKEQAVRALNKAQELAPEDPVVRDAFNSLGLRRPPILRWWSRDFFLNRWLGRLTWKLGRVSQTRLR